MIKYTLDCPKGHRFESWFQSGAAYDDLRDRGLVTCPDCGSDDVTKAIMAPSVKTAKRVEVAEKLQALRAEVEAKSEYVGKDFAHQARAMHLGDAPERAIYGEAKLEDAKALIDDGVPIMPLPFIPKSKAN
ncbi:DUF1178 family protein [Roseibaca sp. V10]|uniref:DUF1178 family protein n=1 Tax=Roseinatronobacter domitianus TaxID=2940293 RepID=A0ABT0M3I7_9RHOB|nr:DUF1178 family protein [Roseibaca domitiana]MCL1629416.1 DUF1178 family protein [Roseibaca domitiana]